MSNSLSTKRRILVQLDPDTHASVFDSVVAVDAGADVLLRHANVEPSDVRNLVYGLIFTRGGADLRHSAIFIGGSDVTAAEHLMQQVQEAFIGPLRVSVMIDPSGANTTAAAAVRLASHHVSLAKSSCLVLGATGPVGRRVVRLLAKAGAQVAVASRAVERAQLVVDEVAAQTGSQRLTAIASTSHGQLQSTLDDVDAIIAAGAPGVELLPQDLWESRRPKLLIDLNAVPPLGIGGVQAQDRAQSYGESIAYGALGVGQTKMQLHKAAIRSLFESNDQIMDVDALYDLSEHIET